MRRKLEEVQVEEYRGHSIVLNKTSGKFLVLEIANAEGQESIQKARALIESHIRGMNKGVRQKVLVFNETYVNDEQPREILEGELTSWTRARRYGGSVEGVVSFGKNSRSTYYPDQIFLDTKENRRLMEQVLELERERVAKKKAIDRIVDKQLEHVKVAEAFAIPSEE